MSKRADHHFLKFTKKERNGTIFLLFLIVIMLLAPYLYSTFFIKESAGSEVQVEEFQALDSLNYAKQHQEYGQQTYVGSARSTMRTSSVFYFDPNTIDTEGWRRLGLNEKVIKTIQKYLSKGGKFKESNDLKNIWGLKDADLKRILPYVKIQGNNLNRNNTFEKTERATWQKEIFPIELNSADSSGYVSLPGIGPGFARRIIKFRDRLGGFHDVDQLKEVFGLPDSVFQKIKGKVSVSPIGIRKIDINTVSLEELKQHPYVRYHLANAIIQYRTQHGNFQSLNDLKHLMLITDEVLSKLSPYFIVGH